MTLNGVALTFTAVLDPNQLKVSFSYTGSILSTTSGAHSISMQAVDGRDTSATAVQSTNTLIVKYACDSIGISTTGSKFLFKDSSITNNQTFTYYVGLDDIGQVSFTSSAVCTGFTGTQSTAYFIQNTLQVNTTMNTNTSAFQECQKSMTQDICFLLDQTNQQLKYFSKQGSNYTYYIQIFAKFVGTDKNGTKYISSNQQALSIVLKTYNYVCRNTTFTYQVFRNQESLSQQSLDFQIDINAQVVTNYRFLFNNTCKSSRLECDGTNNCGLLHFNLSADSSDVNFQVSQDYLESTNLIIQNDPFQHTFDIIFLPQENLIIEQPMVYKLVVGLQTLKELYPSLDPIQQHKISLNFFGIKLKITQLDVNYYIGLQNDSFRLPSYIIFPSKFSIVSITVQQISGPSIPSSEIIVNPKTLTFQLLTKDIAFSNTTATFILTAILNNPQNTNNSDLVINVNFIGFNEIKNNVISNSTQSKPAESTSAELKQAESSKTELTINGWTPPQRNNSMKEIKINYKPAWIQEITQTGLVNIRFGKNLYLPFVKDLNQIIARNLTLQNYINKNNTLIQLQKNNGLQKLNWTATNMTMSSLEIQIVFDNPLLISADTQDYLLVKFNDIDLFLLQNKQGYLFPNKSYASLSSIIPAQFPNQQMEQLLQSVSTVTQSSGGVIIVVSLIIQIIAKKVIQAIWAYFSALQLILVICQESNIQNSASVITLTNAIDDIISLSALDKQSIIDGMNFPSALSQGLQNYKTIALIAGPLAIIVLIILVVSKVLQNKTIQNILNKIKLVLFWNFMIRYFQASYINFQFSSMTQIVRGTALNKSTSSLVLIFQYSVVLMMFIFLYKVDLETLDKEDSKKKVGNLYLGLNTRKRQSIMYSVCFYIQRTLVIAVLATNANFGVQTVLIQSILLLNAAFLYSVRPYLLECDSIPEDLNTLALLILQELQLLQSPWVGDPQAKFYFGIVYDCVIILLFLVNVLLVLRIVQRDGTVKLKRAYVVFKRKQEQQLFQKWYTKEMQRENKIVEELEHAQKIWETNYRLQKQQQNQIQLEEISDLEANSLSQKTESNQNSVRSFDRYACKVMDQEQLDLSVNQDIESQIIARSHQKSQKRPVFQEDAKFEEREEDEQFQIQQNQSNVGQGNSQDCLIDAKIKRFDAYQLPLPQFRTQNSGTLQAISKPVRSKSMNQVSEISSCYVSESSVCITQIEEETLVKVKHRKHKGSQLLQQISEQYSKDGKVSNAPHTIKHKQELKNKQKMKQIIKKQKSQIYISSESDFQVQENQVNESAQISGQLYSFERYQNQTRQQQPFNEDDESLQHDFGAYPQNDKEQTQKWLEQKDRQARTKRLNAEAQLRILMKKEPENIYD